MPKSDDLIWTRESRTSKRLTGQLAMLALVALAAFVTGVLLVVIVRLV